MTIPQNMWMISLLRSAQDTTVISTTLPYLIVVVVYTIVSSPTIGSVRTAVVSKMCLVGFAIFFAAVAPLPSLSHKGITLSLIAMIIEATFAGSWDAMLLELIISAPPTTIVKVLQSNLMLLVGIFFNQSVLPVCFNQFGLSTHHSYGLHWWDPELHAYTILFHAMSREVFVFCLPLVFARLAIVKNSAGARVLSKQSRLSTDVSATTASTRSINVLHYCGLWAVLSIAWKAARDSILWIRNPISSILSGKAYLAHVMAASEFRKRLIRPELSQVVKGPPGSIWIVSQESWTAMDIWSVLDAWTYILVTIFFATTMYGVMITARNYLER